MRMFSIAEPTVKAAAAGTGGRGWALSRSTFVGSGQWVAHWLGDNWSDWENLRFSIIGMLQFSRFAIPHVGAGNDANFSAQTGSDPCSFSRYLWIHQRFRGGALQSLAPARRVLPLLTEPQCNRQHRARSGYQKIC